MTLARTYDNPRDPALEVDLLAYADDMLPAERVPEMEAALADDPDAREAVRAWRDQARLIRAEAAKADELPVNLQIASLERQLGRKLRARRLRAALAGPHMRSAAAAVLIFAAGWGTSALMGPRIAPASAYPAYVERALGGHLLYADETSETRQFTSAEFQTAVQYISEQFGYHFQVAAFELPDYDIEMVHYMQKDDGPVALFSYRDASGGPATLAIQPHSPDEPAYDLSIDHDLHRSIAYWSDDDVDYTVIAALDYDRILPMLAAIGAPEAR